jgi:NAD(P)-dependent dehydrogenase (short-subunit alcohol dehydrogenase family)
MRLANKTAVITGAGSGMGKAMAELFAAEGAKVVCADIRRRG